MWWIGTYNLQTPTHPALRNPSVAFCAPCPTKMKSTRVWIVYCTRACARACALAYLYCVVTDALAGSGYQGAATPRHHSVSQVLITGNKPCIIRGSGILEQFCGFSVNIDYVIPTNIYYYYQRNKFIGSKYPQQKKSLNENFTVLESQAPCNLEMSMATPPRCNTYPQE